MRIIRLYSEVNAFARYQCRLLLIFFITIHNWMMLHLFWNLFGGLSFHGLCYLPFHLLYLHVHYYCYTSVLWYSVLWYITSTMSCMEEPSNKGLSKIVTGVQDPRDMFHNDITGFSPILNWTESQVCIMCTFSWWAVIINNLNGKCVVDKDIGRLSLFFSGLSQDTSEITCKVSSSNSGNEFSFSRSTSSKSLSLWTINDCSTTIDATNTSSRSSSSLKRYQR